MRTTCAKITSLFLRLGPIVLALASIASANTVVYNGDGAGSPFVVFNMTGFATTGADMVGFGLLVNVHFSDASSSGPVAWTNTATCTAVGLCGQASGVAGNGVWTLTETGDTGSVANPANPDGTALRAWTLTNTSTNLAISSVQLIGGGRISFDRDRVTNAGPPTGGQIGTPGSNFGIDYVFASESGANNPFTVGVTYDNIIQFFTSQACQGAAFAANNTLTGCGDEWNNVTFTFTVGTFQGTVGGGNAVWGFFQDTDTIGVPEPATVGLMSAGLLLGVFAYRKRRLAR